MALNDDGTAKLVFISYNMHGYNQDIVVIQHLIDTVSSMFLRELDHRYSLQLKRSNGHTLHSNATH